MKKTLIVLLTLIALTICFSSNVYAQATTIISDTSKAAFTASSDHNTLFAGSPVLTSYSIDVYLKTNSTGTGTPVTTASLGKPTPNATNDVISGNLKTILTLSPNTEYIYFVRAIGPGGSNRSIASDPFGFPGAPAAIVGKPGIQ